MAGFDRIYCLGPEGGFMGSDGLNEIHIEILHGISDREWYEARYWKPFSPMCRVRTFIPKGPDDEDALLDAMLALTPELFDGCDALEGVSRAVECSGKEMLDFNLEPTPEDWAALREQARPIFKRLALYSAELQPIFHRDV
jgi:hypothetical protein